MKTKIRELRKQRKMSQEQLAKLVSALSYPEKGVTTGTVSHWETGTRDIPGRQMEKVAKALGVSVAELAGNSSDEFDKNVLALILEKLEQRLEQGDGIHRYTLSAKDKMEAVFEIYKEIKGEEDPESREIAIQVLVNYSCRDLKAN